MYLKNKKITLKNFLFLYVFLVSAFSLLSYHFFIENFKELESNKNHKELNFIFSNISSEMKHIENITNDYSYWDDTYDFMQNSNKSYINENFRKGTNTLNELGLDFMIYVTLDNNVLYSHYKEKSGIKDIKTFETNVTQISLNNREFNSLFVVDSNIFYLRKSKIVQSDKKGKFNGFIYSGKFIDENYFNNQKNFFKEINITFTEDENLTNEKELSYLHNINLQTKSYGSSIINTINFFDIFDNYLFSLELKNTMDIVNAGKTTIWIYNLAIALVLAIIFFILLRVQNDLTDYNAKLELEISKRTKKLNEYVNIVNQYVTTSSTDLEGKITSVSEAFCRICGYSKEELIGKTHNVVKHTDMDPLVYEDLWNTITAGKKWVGEIQNKKKNGEAYWVLAHIDPMYDEKGKMIGYTSIRQEITDKKRVEKLSITDKLTQLYNRVRLDEIFTIEIAKFYRYNTHFSIIIIDIDHFKDVNDTYGHNVGDSVLKEFASILKSSVRIEDVVGRWGGEEFIILTSNYSVDGIASLAEKIRKNIESHEFAIVGKKTASFGVACLTEGDDQESLLARADEALYKAKNSGRNKVCL